MTTRKELTEAIRGMRSKPTPYGYFVALFTKLPLAHTVDDYEALLPWRLAQSTGLRALFTSRLNADPPLLRSTS